MELLGYASGDDHLYLVYEYILNGSLSDHLHDPLLKGIQIRSASTSVSKILLIGLVTNKELFINSLGKKI